MSHKTTATTTPPHQSSPIPFNLNSQSISNLTFDRRRFTGPESSTSLPLLTPTPSDSSVSSIKRPDGRSALDLRPIHIKTGVICSANGSCYVEAENVKVICAVYGPKPRPTSLSTSSPLIITFKFAPFALPGARLPTSNLSPESAAAQSLHQALAPALLSSPADAASVTDLHITILQSDGPQALSHAILAASVALAAAGVPTIGLVMGVSAALPGQGNQPFDILVDPTGPESTLAAATFDVACIPVMDTVTHLSFRAASDWQQGAINLEHLDSCLDQCRSTAHLIHGLAVAALQQDLGPQAIVQS